MKKQSRWQHFKEWYSNVHWAYKVLAIVLLVLAVIFIVAFVLVVLYAVVTALVYLFGGSWLENIGKTK
jgi:hypothetical protein